MTHREKLEKAISHLESQRQFLSDAPVDAAVAVLRAELESPAGSRTGPKAPAGHAAERKLVTVMFADIAGFTALSERMDPESIRDIMNSCFERLTPIIEAYEGTVDKFIGDNIMSLFGAPVAHENDAERALSAALEMAAELEAFNGERGLDLGLHFGINTGLVIAGGIGTSKRMDYSVMGDTVNVAARLEDASERGEILVGPDTYRLAASLFDFEKLDPIRLKGKSEPLPAYRLLAKRTGLRRSGRLRRNLPGSRLVGRDEELAAMRGCVNDVLDGKGGILAVSGEAGMGKSRLVAEIRDHFESGARARELLWLEGNAVSFGRAISFLPFREIISQAAGISDEDNEESARRKLELFVFSLFRARTPEVLPYLAMLISVEVPGRYAERVKYLDSEAAGRQVFLACRALFEQLARVQPLVVVLEDLHWADASSKLLLESLIPLVERVPLLVCCTFRPDHGTGTSLPREMASDVDASRYVEVGLAPLSKTHSARLVLDLLEGADIPEKLRDSMLSRADGNPYFIEEIIQSLVDMGAARFDRASGRWIASARAESAVIPDSIQGVIMGRMDLLDEDVKRVLRAAAVIGRSFLSRVLQAICHPAANLSSRLGRLQENRVIVEKQRFPEPEYAFRHALAQEVLYGSILVGERKELHARVGKAIETIFPDRSDELAGLLAFHYAQAENWEKAREYLFRAGDQAERIAADNEALLLYEQALSVHQRVMGDTWDPVESASLARKMGSALFRRGEYSSALDFVQSGLHSLGRSLPVSLFRIGVEIGMEALAQLLHRIFPKRIGGSSDSADSPAVEEEILLYEVAGWIDAFGNYQRLLLLALRVLNVSERSGFAYGVSKGSMAMGTIFDLFALFRGANYYHTRALTIARRIGHQGAVGLAQAGLALHENCLGNWPAAIEWAARSAKVFQDTGDLHSQGFAVYMKAVALAYEGKLRLALREADDLVELGQQGSDPQVLSWGLSTRGFVLRMSGRTQDALSALRAAVEPANEAHDYAVQMWIGSESARCFLAQGSFDEAAAVLDRSWELHGEHSRLSLIWVSLHNAAAEMLLTFVEHFDGGWAGDSSPPEASPCVDPERRSSRDGYPSNLLRAARSACKEALKNARSFRGLMPETMRLQGTYWWLRGRPAKARTWWGKSIELARTTGQRYDLASTLREMGRRTGDKRLPAEGDAILAEIGSITSARDSA